MSIILTAIPLQLCKKTNDLKKYESPCKALEGLCFRGGAISLGVFVTLSKYYLMNKVIELNGSNDRYPLPSCLIPKSKGSKLGGK